VREGCVRAGRRPDGITAISALQDGEHDRRRPSCISPCCPTRVCSTIAVDLTTTASSNRDRTPGAGHRPCDAIKPQRLTRPASTSPSKSMPHVHKRGVSSLADENNIITTQIRRNAESLFLDPPAKAGPIRSAARIPARHPAPSVTRIRNRYHAPRRDRSSWNKKTFIRGKTFIFGLVPNGIRWAGPSRLGESDTIWLCTFAEQPGGQQQPHGIRRLG